MLSWSAVFIFLICFIKCAVANYSFVRKSVFSILYAVAKVTCDNLYACIVTVLVHQYCGNYSYGINRAAARAVPEKDKIPLFRRTV